jgi:hypothetical protein
MTISWETSNGADYYEVCYDTTNDNTCDGSWVNVGASTSVDSSGLSYLTTYYWQMRAVNAEGTAEADNGTCWTGRL